MITKNWAYTHNFHDADLVACCGVKKYQVT